MEAPHHKYCKCPDCELFAQMQAHFGTNEPEPNTRAGEALKPCERCGGKPMLCEPNYADEGGTMVVCEDCDLAGDSFVLGKYGEGRAQAITAWNTRPLPQPSELVERPSEAIEVLGGPYRQLDMDGVIVGVSRQAIYETLTYLTQLEAQIAKLQADGEKLAAALEMIAAGHGCPSALATATLTEWKDRA